jgi:hypothetical protein
MFDRERYDLLEKQLSDAGAKTKHYPASVSSICPEQVVIGIDASGEHLSISWSFQDDFVDYMIISHSFGAYISFEVFLEKLPEKYQKIFVFYLDLFDAKNRWM